jgi:hypothetical protein
MLELNDSSMSLASNSKDRIERDTLVVIFFASVKGHRTIKRSIRNAIGYVFSALKGGRVE